jgi:hypothetical protein
MRHLFLVLVLTFPLLVAAPSALAGKPTHERLQIDDEFVDNSCGFPVNVEQTGLVVRITWTAADGSVRVKEAYPQFKATLTNLVTGQSITVNIAGPAHISEGADGSFSLVGTGSWFWPFHPDTGAPGLFQTAGRFVFSIDSEGNDSFSRVGHIVDLCAQVAG